jgi:hypothetical protein
MKKSHKFDTVLLFSRKGQLTIFIIVAVVIVMAIIIYFTSLKDLFNRPIEGSETLRDSIVECLDFTTKNSLYFVSYQGGYNHAPEKHFSFSPTFFPYYYFEGDDLFPTIDLIEKEMAEYVEENLDSCLDDIEGSEFDISYGEPIVKVEITDDEINYIIDMLLVLKRDENSMTLDLSRYPVYHPSNFSKLYEISKFYIDDLKDDPNNYCISCISEMTENNELNFYSIEILDNASLVMVFEKKDNPLILNFGIKFGNNQTNG